jgi:hypothetical protein
MLEDKRSREFAVVEERVAGDTRVDGCRFGPGAVGGVSSAGSRRCSRLGFRVEQALLHGSYYGAFVFDPEGNNIEAVCHGPEQEA